jgi:transcriptional regulator with XRE-family HTH domain
VLKRKLGQKIATLRRATKLTQAQFAEKCGYSIEFISLVERGINAPSVQGCDRIARVLRIPLKELFDF